MEITKLKAKFAALPPKVRATHYLDFMLFSHALENDPEVIPFMEFPDLRSQKTAESDAFKSVVKAK